MILNLIYRCKNNGLRPLREISSSRIFLIFLAILLNGCNFNREKHELTTIDSFVVFDGNYKQKMIRDPRDGFPDFPDTSYESLFVITGLKNSIKSVIEKDSEAVIKLRINDTLPYAFWRLLVSTSKEGGASAIDVFNKSNLQKFRVRFDRCKSDSMCSERVNQMMLRFRLWKDSIFVDSSIIGQEMVCICPPRTIQPDLREKFISSDSAMRYEYILQSIKNRHGDMPIYFDFHPRLSLAELSKVMLPLTSSICTKSNSRKCYFDDLEYLIEDSNGSIKGNPSNGRFKE